MKKSKVANELVPMIEGTLQNQPCIYGELVEGHSVYCNNDRSPYRKCRCSWYYGRVASILDKCADEDCRYFKTNPEYQENQRDWAGLMEQEKSRRVDAEIRHQKLLSEGWLCPDCQECLGYNDTVLCMSGTLVTGMVKINALKQYTDEERSLHFEYDPMNTIMRRECPCFSKRMELI